MISVTQIQQDIIDSDHIIVAWLFIVTDSNGNRYRWGTTTNAETSDGIIVEDESDDLELEPYVHCEADESAAYTFKIMNFSGVTITRSKTESGIVAPNDISFTVSNKDNALTHTDFRDGTVKLMLRMSDGINTERIRQWDFTIKSTEPGAQEFRCYCEDYFKQYLQGNYPNSALTKDIFPAGDYVQDDNACVPIPFGTAYIPLRSNYIADTISVSGTDITAVASSSGSNCKFTSVTTDLSSFESKRYITVSGFTDSGGDINGTHRVLAVSDSHTIEVGITAFAAGEASGNTVSIKQGSRYYILGPTTDPQGSAVTYSISAVNTPFEVGIDEEWTSGSYDFNQSTSTDADGTDWRVFQPIIGSSNNDSTYDSNGLWRSGNQFLDMPTKFSRSDLASKTNPAWIIKYILMDFGISALYINDESFQSAADTFDSWGMSWNGGLYYKMARTELLSLLLNMSHSNLIIGEQIELEVLSKTSQLTLDDSLVTKKADIADPDFNYSYTSETAISDSGSIAYARQDKPQSKLIKVSVPASGTSKDYTSDDVLELPFALNSNDDTASQIAQAIGTLYYQRRYGKIGEVSSRLKPKCIRLDPSDVVTINHADFGGTYDILIDQMSFLPDASIQIVGTRFVYTLQDFSDLSPSAITVDEDDTEIIWQPNIAGPLSSGGTGRTAFTVWGMPYLTVGSVENQGEFNSIQEAINEAIVTGKNRILLLKGSHTEVSAVYLPSSDLSIEGESRESTTLNLDSSASIQLTNGGAADLGTYTFKNFELAYPGSDAIFSLVGSNGSYAEPKIKFLNLMVDGTAGWGFDFVYSDDVTGDDSYLEIQGCRFESKASYPAMIINGSSGLFFVNVNIYNNQCYYCSIESWVASSVTKNLSVKNNILRYVTDTGIAIKADNGIISDNQIYYKETGSLTEITMGILLNAVTGSIIGNQIEMSNTNAIYQVVWGPTGIDCGFDERGVVSNNQVNMNINSTGAGYPSVAAVFARSNSDVVNNQIKIINTCTTMETSGVLIKDAQSVNCSRNNIELNNGSLDYGVWVKGVTSTNNTISDNNFANVLPANQVKDEGAWTIQSGNNDENESIPVSTGRFAKTFLN